MSKHTPGPWGYKDRDFCDRPSEFDLYIIGDIHESYDDEDGEESGAEPRMSCVGIAIVKGNATAGDIPLANARLIAAAPELLEACRQAYSLIGPQHAGPSLDVSNNLREAIEKATGK
jgi:hypothetical protein